MNNNFQSQFTSVQLKCFLQCGLLPFQHQCKAHSVRLGDIQWRESILQTIYPENPLTFRGGVRAKACLGTTLAGEKYIRYILTWLSRTKPLGKTQHETMVFGSDCIMPTKTHQNPAYFCRVWGGSRLPQLWQPMLEDRGHRFSCGVSVDGGNLRVNAAAVLQTLSGHVG